MRTSEFGHHSEHTRQTMRANLSLVLKLNAVSSLATGVLMAALASPLSAISGISATVLTIAGIGLVPFGIAVLRVANDPRPTHVRLVSALDFTWVAASVALVALTPVTALGIALVLAIALVVDVFGMLQLYFVRAQRPAHAM
jgi:hypothetical protein